MWCYLEAFSAVKHSLQYTGLPRRGWKGTSASVPQVAQIIEYIARGPPSLFCARRRAARQSGAATRLVEKSPFLVEFLLTLGEEKFGSTFSANQVLITQRLKSS